MTKVPYLSTAFGLDKPSKRKGRGDKDPKHLAFIRCLPCTVCGTYRNVESAHVSYPDPAQDKPGRGYGQKVADRWAVPLCSACHREQHGLNERAFWEHYKIDPVNIAARLYAATGDTDAGDVIVRRVSSA